MEDIGKELCERVREVFEQRNSSNAFMVRLKKEIADGRATLRDTSIYSQTLGINLRRAIKEVVTPDELPDSTLYYNIAHSILEPLLRDTYEDVNAICAEVQRKLDDKAGIHLAPQKADFPAERVRAACGSASVKDTAEHGIEVLERTSENITAAFSDDYMKANADFRARAGLDTYIERRDDGKCCAWCSKLAGRYRYPDGAPRDVFRRHDNCGCTVEYVSSRGRQNVWTKRENSPLYDKEYLKDRDKIKAAEREHRRQLGLNYKGPVRLSRKRARELEKRLTEGQKRGIMYSGAVSGGLKHDSERAFEHAKRYYESVRHMSTDVKRIAENTGFDEKDIAAIKDFVFMQKHDLGNEELEYFYPNYAMAQSWQRLIDGKNIQPHDITLLNHEKMEKQLMMQGYTQDEAHRITEQTYNYAKESKEYYAKIEEHKNKR